MEHDTMKTAIIDIIYSQIVQRWNFKFCNICFGASFRNKLKEFEGIKLMPHPAYSQDLAPSDNDMFQFMAHYLCFTNQRGGSFSQGVLRLEKQELELKKG